MLVYLNNMERINLLIIIILFSTLNISFLSAEEFGYNLIEPDPFDNNTAFVNESANWVTTSLGVLSDVNSTQFSNQGGVLTAMKSWWDGLYCQITGCTMGGDIDMDGNDITMGGGNLVNVNRITLDSEGEHIIRTNIDGFPFGGIANNAIIFEHEDESPEGEITYLFSHENETNLWMQSGRNNSFSGLGNSFGLIPQYMATENFTEGGSVNMSKASDYIILCDSFGVDCNFHADTRGNAIDLIPGGPLLFTMGDMEVWQTLKVHKGIAVEGVAVFDLQGQNVNFNNGSVHISEPVIFTRGFIEGQPVRKFLETFDGGLGIFTNIQTDLGNWLSVINPVSCDQGDCAMGSGAGSGLVEMQTNISTLDINETTLSFVYSLVNLVGAGEFSVEVNNNVGSGDVVIFSDTTTSVVTEAEVISLPSSMDDQASISITFICDVGSSNRPSRECFVDTVKLNGTATSTTLINVSGFDSVILFGDGSLASDGFPNRGIFYNGSGDQITIRGNATFDKIIEKDLNVTNSISLNSTTIFDWAGVVNSPLFPGYFLLNGSSVMQGDSNIGGFDITNVASGFFSFIGSSVSRITKAWFVDLDVSNNINVTGNYLHQGTIGFTGSCVNATYSGGIVISCNDV